jgi:hypothetical protein
MEKMLKEEAKIEAWQLPKELGENPRRPKTTKRARFFVQKSLEPKL